MRNTITLSQRNDSPAMQKNVHIHEAISLACVRSTSELTSRRVNASAQRKFLFVPASMAWEPPRVLLSAGFARLSLFAWLAIAIAMVLHYLLFGPRHREISLKPRNVRRFSFWTIGVHAVVAVSFLTLAITGFVAVFRDEPMSASALLWHCVVGIAFAAGLGLMVVTWAHSARFEWHDLVWLRHLGGYLGGRQDVPASRFNAGQKGYFWFVAVVGAVVALSGVGRLHPGALPFLTQTQMLALHRAAALALVAGFLLHFYLGTFANPGTLLGIITGRVSEDWAKHHHPLWWATLQREKGGNDNA